MSLASVGSTPANAYSAVAIDPANIDKAIASLDGQAEDLLKRDGIPGIAIAVVRDGKTVYSKGFGVRDVNTREPVNTDTVFQIASSSKSIGSTCVSKAVTDKIVKWSDPVEKYLPGFQLSDPEITKMVTIADLYSHRSGLPGYVGDDIEGLGYSRQHIFDSFKLFPLNPFRITWGYSNFGMTAGGEAVANAAGTDWATLCDRELYKPLGMTATSSRYADYLKATNRATINLRVAPGKYRPDFKRDPDAQAPAGGVSTTINDMAKWMAMVLAGGKVGTQQLIAPEVLQESLTPQIRNMTGDALDARSESYGYGFNVKPSSTGEVVYGHSGAFYIGAGSNFTLIPAANVGIAIFTNGTASGVPEGIASTFSDLVRYGSIERDWYGDYAAAFRTSFTNHSPVAKPAPADAKPARPLADYVGTYNNAYVGDVVVAQSGDHLVVTIGPRKMSASLGHYDGDMFAWKIPGEGADPGSALTFSGGGTGKATTMTIEGISLGELSRK